MADKNKQIEATGIAILVATILAIVTWQSVKGSITMDTAITIYVIAVPFAIGLYVNSSAPSKAQILTALWGVFLSVVNKKLDIPQALKEIEIIIMNAVNMWYQLNQKVENDAKKPGTTTPTPAKA